MSVIYTLSTAFIDTYNSFISTLPPLAQKFINLFLIVLLIVIYSIFIWKFYRFIATKDIIRLNLNRYNRAEHPLLAKLFAGIFYLLEYILILPFLIFFWFSIFTIFLIFLTENLAIENLLIISAIIIASIRMVSYYNEDLSKDLAKLLPFTLLAISIINPKFFDINRIFNNLSEITGFFNEIIIYLAFIIILEMILRFFDFIFSLFGLEDSPNIEER
ncbi:hypothetical protein CMI49_02165 [Candidatus Pacearchaeota archaeon]|jgi:hypothetical protein|nr:hypothetical protein [Candidatus Pacearchaeota archaeon]|tara:strand:- start:4771 stop:5421 length:651 start_codon:yes stop_codon:yes gene_type:complete